MKPHLTIDALRSAASEFAGGESGHLELSLYGVTDGKAVGTYLEQKSREFLRSRFEFEAGNAARGIELPGLGLDNKRALRCLAWGSIRLLPGK